MARGVLGTRATSAVFDQGFGNAGAFVTHAEESLDTAAYVEMIMFLRSNYESIPSSIPKLPVDKLEGFIPHRLRSPRIRAISLGPASGW